MPGQDHIGIIRLSALGDVAMTVPVIRVLRATYPNLEITIISRSFFKPFFQELDGVHFIEADVKGEHKGIPGLLKLAGLIRQSGVTAVADLHDVIRSKILVTSLRSRGLRCAVIDKGRKEKRQLIRNKGAKLANLKSTHQRYADVLAGLGYPIDLDKHQYPQRPSLTPRLSNWINADGNKLIGIAPFAAYRSKTYPLDLMHEVLSGLDQKGKYQILLFGGGKQEVEQLDALANGLDSVVSVAGRMTLAEELILIANLDLMVAMDSGNGHLAAMFDLPVITLWGVTHPAAGFTPFGQSADNQLLSDREQFPLIPTSVYGNKYPESYMEVMRTISPEQIATLISKRLS
ncbi:glycosyltransferase family 9 protein [Aureitalea marina]|uniref:ADP-heptose--LPS heptosyltransferase RfaF n=1 Tax=Aureitalea marina TaxID=930804 RepID=A0A2S7KSA7_9FLAO|nr:glycosyltransferase family 9 protein [Aureitalea marina]PQB05500.1 ADP-heptose--LPS heptosyltransferase RfaF [Aureitalea marina]